MDNVKYFIEMRYNLEDLKRVYERMLEQITNVKELKGISSQEYEIIETVKSNFNPINSDEIHKLDLTIAKINGVLYETCKHSWESDVIDINVERTLQIEYCNICESTKKYNN